MPADELVVRLQATLDEIERLAKAATPGPWRYNPRKEWHEPTALAFPPELRPPGEEFVGAGPLDATVGVAATGPTDHPQSMADAAFIAANDPQSVLRLVRSHRDILDEWCKWRGSCTTERQLGYFAALGLSVRALARGYGLEVQ